MQRIINFTYAALGVCFVVKISFFNERAVVHRDNKEGIILYGLLYHVLALIAHSFFRVKLYLLLNSDVPVCPYI